MAAAEARGRWAATDCPFEGCAYRVPFQALVDYLEGNHTLEEFLGDFPTVSRALAIAALEQAKELLVAGARPA